MKQIGYILGVMLSVLVLTSCGGKIKSSDTFENFDLNSYEGISSAIDEFVEPGHWNTSDYKVLSAAIKAAFDFEQINDIEATDLDDKLIKESNKYLYVRVDSTFKCSQYVGLKELNEIQIFLKNENTRLSGIHSLIMNPDKTNEKIVDIFRNYKTVYSIATSDFIKSPVYLANYNVDARSKISIIENNKYWKDYFCHNSEILRGKNGIPARVKTAKVKYLYGLERLIEKKAVNEGFSVEQLMLDQRTFNGYISEINDNDNNTLKSKLSDFVNNYPPK